MNANFRTLDSFRQGEVLFVFSWTTLTL